MTSTKQTVSMADFERILRQSAYRTRDLAAAYRQARREGKESMMACLRKELELRNGYRLTKTKKIS